MLEPQKKQTISLTKVTGPHAHYNNLAHSSKSTQTQWGDCNSPGIPQPTDKQILDILCTWRQLGLARAYVKRQKREGILTKLTCKFLLLLLFPAATTPYSHTTHLQLKLASLQWLWLLLHFLTDKAQVSSTTSTLVSYQFNSKDYNSTGRLYVTLGQLQKLKEEQRWQNCLKRTAFQIFSYGYNNILECNTSNSVRRTTDNAKSSAKKPPRLADWCADCP
jgi:hypothetical protein